LPALVIILALAGAIVMTILRFRTISVPAAVLLVPYFLWVGYATYLNAGFWWLNR
jgi:tryptophan-rich sensory protein